VQDPEQGTDTPPPCGRYPKLAEAAVKQPVQK
jgi:hypothetical protein